MGALFVISTIIVMVAVLRSQTASAAPAPVAAALVAAPAPAAPVAAPVAAPQALHPAVAQALAAVAPVRHPSHVRHHAVARAPAHRVYAFGKKPHKKDDLDKLLGL
jgi:hypothetical protein